MSKMGFNQTNKNDAPNLRSIDMISMLPNNIIELILKFLPLRDTARTSILSKRWRYLWRNLPQLIFDSSFNSNPDKDARDVLITILQILLLHEGSISKFTLDISTLTSFSSIDTMILFLSRKGIQDFTLNLSCTEYYEMPSDFYTSLKLTHLRLNSCVFEPPRGFDGFRRLVRLKMKETQVPPTLSIFNCPLLETFRMQTWSVIQSFSIDAPRLKKFVFVGTIKSIGHVNIPLVEHLSFATDPQPSEGELAFDLISNFLSLPHIRRLHLDSPYIKMLAVENAPEKLPCLLNSLRHLELTAICFTDLEEFIPTLRLIRSTPNLQKLGISVCSDNDFEYNPEDLRMQDYYSNISWDKLLEVELDSDMSGCRPELDFIKFLLTSSPALEKMKIGRSNMTDIDYTNMVVGVTRFRLASKNAEIIFPRTTSNLEQISG